MDKIMTTRRRFRFLVGALAIALGAVPADAGSANSKAGSTKSDKADQRLQAKMSGKLRQDAKRRSGGPTMDVLVRYRKAPTALDQAFVAGLGGEIRRKGRRASSSRWVTVRVPVNALDKLADNANVDYI